MNAERPARNKNARTNLPYRIKGEGSHLMPFRHASILMLSLSKYEPTPAVSHPHSPFDRLRVR